MNTNRLFRTAAIWLGMMSFASSAAFGQKPSAENYTPEELQQHFANVAKKYEITAGGDKLRLESQPLMNWQNPARKREQGALFVWLKHGQPQVLASIFTYGGERGTVCRHEMISLSESPLESKLDGVGVWAPKRRGVEWKPVTPEIPPAKTNPRRLVQMRTIARTFEGKLLPPGDQTSKLTLIPQPVVRYESVAEGVVDGAIFSLAVATDPELFLLIEAKRKADGSVSWHYAAVRSHFWALELSRGGEVVWQTEAVPELLMTNAADTPWMNNPYFIFFESQALPAPETLR